MDELTHMAPKGAKSKHDDFMDTISMLAFINAWKPGVEIDKVADPDSDIWEFEKQSENNRRSSYIV
jgi:hypothetical protein